MENKKKYCPLLFNHKPAEGNLKIIDPEETARKCKEGDCSWWSIDKTGIGKCTVSGINELARLLSDINGTLARRK